MYKPTYKKRTARMISWVCGSLFTLFSLLYLFVMQADLLATAQHLLSKGQTVYSPLWGTVIITFLLLLLQGVFRRIMVYPLRFHALYYSRRASCWDCLRPLFLKQGGMYNCPPIGYGSRSVFFCISL